MKTKKKIPYIAIGPIITLIIMLVLYAINGIFPFGNLTTSYGDGVSQYAPLLSEMTDKISNGGSWFYSWHTGGLNFWSNITYYLVSPLNLIALAFKDNVFEAVSILNLIKPVLMALTMGIFLRYAYNKNDISIPIFSVAWAMSGFVVATYHILSWADAIIYFPLVILGLKRLMDGKSAWLYSLFLGLTITSNFYIGWITCIFCIIYFIYSFIADDEVVYEGVKGNMEDEIPENQESVNLFSALGNSYILKTFFKFVGSSLIAGALSAIFTLPAFITLQSTQKGVVYDMNINPKNPWGLLASHIFPGSIAYDMKINFDYIYCFIGISALILCVSYFFTKGISVRKKFGNGFLLLVMWISIIFTFIYRVWHGFGFPAGIMYRFAFIYSFILIKIAYESFINIKNSRTVGIVVGSIFGMVCISGIYLNETLREKLFSWGLVAIIATLIVVYMVILLLLAKKVKLNSVLSVVLLCLISAESLVLNIDNFKVKSNPTDEIFIYGDDVRDANTYKEEYECMEFDSNYSKYNEMVMHNALYNYNGREYYSSMADGDYTLTVQNFGVYGNRINLQEGGSEQSPVYNLVMPTKLYLDGYGTVSQSWFRKPIKQYDDLTLYKNNYTMPFMYTVSNGIKKWDPFAFFSPADNTREVFKAITGLDKDVSLRADLKNFEYENCEYISNYDRVSEMNTEHGEDTSDINKGYFDYLEDIKLRISCKIHDMKKPAYVDFDIVPEDDGLLYFFVDTSELTDLEITVNGKVRKVNLVTKQDGKTFELGDVKKGDNVHVKIGGYNRDANDEFAYVNKTTVFSAIAYTVNEDIFKEGYEKLDAMSDTEMLEFKDTYVKARVNSFEDGILYIPTTDDPGWTVYIDGVETPRAKAIHQHGDHVHETPIPSHILMTEITKGEHIVEMKYIPKGFKEGAIITGVSVAILIAWGAITLVKNKKALNTQDENSEKSEE